MTPFIILTIIIFLAALFGYVNVRFLKLPTTIGLMLITIVFSLAIFGISFYDDTLLDIEEYIITKLDFRTLLLDVMFVTIEFPKVLGERARARNYRRSTFKNTVFGSSQFFPVLKGGTGYEMGALEPKVNEK